MPRAFEQFEVPAGARELELQLVFVYTNSSNGANGMVDNLSARIVPLALPAPLPLGQELVVNGDFEGGWRWNSPLTPGVPGGWEGMTNSTARVFDYQDGRMPGPVVAQSMMGGQFLLSDHSGGAERMRQSFDLRGNAREVDLGLLTVHLSGWLGG